jgi:peptidoglycan/LPS O-acetylase OafA/YrhL
VKYEKHVDGLRALAVLAVVADHLGYRKLSGGFVGVDVFFVISGYLITGILVEDLSVGRFSIRRFYNRRIRRIYPALIVALGSGCPAFRGQHLVLDASGLLRW